MGNNTDYPAKQILIFDSGVGGLSIAEEVQQQLPSNSIVYCSDNAAFPYGTKSEKELIERSEQVLQALLSKEHCDIIIIACNSASTLALPHIRRLFKQPVIGVVPAIKPATALTKNQQVGLLATPGTVSRTYTHKLIDDFAQNCNVHMLGSAVLVHLAEKKLRGETISPNLLAPILEPLKAQNIDTLILACTHFPLLKKEIQAWFGSSVTLIDSANAIARRAKHLLTKHATADVKNHKTTAVHRCYFTADTKDIQLLKPALARYHFNEIFILDT